MPTMPRSRRLPTVLVAAAISLILGILGVGTAAPASSATSLPGASLWVDSWAAAPQSGDEGVPGLPVVTPFANQTLRLIEHPHTGGTITRIQLSNVFGTQPVVIGQRSE